MPFETVSGLKGKVYVPRAPDLCAPKHRCPECYVCQNCSDDRCRVCRSQRKCRRKTPWVHK